MDAFATLDAEPLSVSLESRGGMVVACARGSLDVYTVEGFAAALAGIARSGSLVIDLNGLTMIDAAGVRALRAQVDARPPGHVVIVCPPGWLRATLAVATIGAPLPLVDDDLGAWPGEAPASGSAPRRSGRRSRGWPRAGLRRDVV